MRALRYAINVTLDGCCDHRAIPADEELHRHFAEEVTPKKVEKDGRFQISPWCNQFQLRPLLPLLGGDGRFFVLAKNAAL